MSAATALDPRHAYIGIGSNLAEPALQVLRAIAAIDAHPHLRLVARSRLYGNPAVGPVPQPDFVNAVVLVESALDARGTLDALLGIEAALGRVRGTLRWGPRVIDLDLLVHGERVVEEPGLEVPHPRIAERAFVLVPLAEIAPSLELPGLGPVGGLLERVGIDALEPLDECVVGNAVDGAALAAGVQ